jgi:hypothetical protein
LKTIVITISPTGETKLETRGYAGESCRDASRWLELALGHVTCDEPTAELYQTAPPERLFHELNPPEA